jgi:hypothetical protein
VGSWLIGNSAKLAAVWIVGLLSSNGTPDVPKSVVIAFQSYSDIRDPGTYTAPDVTGLQQAQDKSSRIFHSCFTEWWRAGEREKLEEPFDFRNELVVMLLRVLEEVCAFFIYRPSDKPAGFLSGKLAQIFVPA